MKEKDQKEPSELEPEAIRVTDRRFWVRKDWDAADKSTSRKPKVLEELEEKLKSGEDTILEIKDRARKLQQESEAFRQRLERDQERKVSLSRGEFLREILEVLDNLERSLAVASQGPEEIPAFQALTDGLEMVRSLFLDKLARFGVSRVEVLDASFNPEVAEAIDVVETEDPDLDNVVVEVLQEAYRMEERVLRPARVKVARLFKKKTQEEMDAKEQDES